MSFTTEQPGGGSRPITLVSQLRQHALKMRHIDEMFSWTAQGMVKQWQIPLIQFWAVQGYTTGQFRLELRTFAHQNPSLPASIHANQQVADVVKRLLREKQGMPSLPVRDVFSSSQVEALTSHNLYYWTAYFIENALSFPPKRKAVPEQIPTPLTMLISLFLQQPPIEPLDRAIDFTFQHCFLVAAKQGFLTPPQEVTPTDTNHAEMDTESSGKQAQDDLSALVPHRAENIEELQISNPFVHATILPDKKTRRVYSLVNGQRDIATITRVAGLTQKEVLEALCLLLQQERIGLRDVKGNSIDADLVFNYS